MFALSISILLLSFLSQRVAAVPNYRPIGHNGTPYEYQSHVGNDQVQDIEDSNTQMDQMETAFSLNASVFDSITEHQAPLGTLANPAPSCDYIRRQDKSARIGLYYLKDLEGKVFQTFCYMAATGGWTLVASIHENNMEGRCTDGDRWSSQQGNNANHPDGDGFWANRATYGSATSATSDDYKNSGYFAMPARDVMIWQVPNDTPMSSFVSRAFLKYHTNNGFLQGLGGNLASLYKYYYHIKAKQFRANIDNGPAIPIAWDTGSNEELLNLYGPSVREGVEAGFIQFRAINSEADAFALCPGVRIRSGFTHVEHPCIGSTSSSPNVHHCGDYAWRDIDDERYIGYRLDQRLIESVVMILYK